MTGIYVGGRYVPNCGKVTTYAWCKTSWFYLNDMYKPVRGADIRPGGDMYRCSPEILAFWSDDE